MAGPGLEGDLAEDLLPLFKALADANRLKIIGLLAEKPLSVQELAGLVSLSASTVSHHLSALASAGLVSARAEGYYNVYRLETAVLETLARRLQSQEILAGAAGDLDLDAYDRKVLADYSLADGRLKSIPAQRKKLEAVLKGVIRAFEPGERYTEREVNDILSRFHPDTASLRRELVGFHLLQREANGSAYWREPEE